jgi:hypothetical protein
VAQHSAQRRHAPRRFRVRRMAQQARSADDQAESTTSRSRQHT